MQDLTPGLVTPGLDAFDAAGEARAGSRGSDNPTFGLALATLWAATRHWNHGGIPRPRRRS